MPKGGKLKAKEVKDFLNASYDKTPPNDLDGYILDKSLSSSTAKVYYNPQTNHAVVAHRGTQGTLDWGNNLAYALGAYEYTNRYKQGKKTQDKAETKYGKKNISTLGHSQGSILARKLGTDTKEVINVNPAYTFERPAKNEYNIRSSTDVVSGLYAPVAKTREILFPKYSEKHDITIPSQSTFDVLGEHSYDILDRLGEKEIGVGAGNKISSNSIMYKAGKRYSRLGYTGEDIDWIGGGVITTNNNNGAVGTAHVNRGTNPYGVKGGSYVGNRRSYANLQVSASNLRRRLTQLANSLGQENFDENVLDAEIEDIEEALEQMYQEELAGNKQQASQIATSVVEQLRELNKDVDEFEREMILHDISESEEEESSSDEEEMEGGNIFGDPVTALGIVAGLIVGGGGLIKLTSMIQDFINTRQQVFPETVAEMLEDAVEAELADFDIEEGMPIAEPIAEERIAPAEGVTFTGGNILDDPVKTLGIVAGALVGSVGLLRLTAMIQELINTRQQVFPETVAEMLEQAGDTDSETDTSVSQTEVRDVEATGGKIKNPFKKVGKVFAPVKKTFDKAGVKLNTGAAKVATAINPMTYALANKDTRNAMIQSGKITHDYLLPAVVSAGKPIFDATAMVGSTMLTGNPLLGKVAADTVWNEMVAKRGNDPRQNQKSKELGELSTVFGQALAKPYSAALSGTGLKAGYRLKPGYRLKGGMVDEESDDELAELMGQMSFPPAEERYRPSAIPPELKRPVIIRRPVKIDKEVAQVGKRKAEEKAEGKEKKGKGRDKLKNIDFEKIKFGTFTRMFKEFKKENPRARVKDLEAFAKRIIKNKKNFSEKAFKKANFYLNVIKK